MKIFYARCSTAEQNESRQLKDAEACGADKVYIDKLSGKNLDRPQLKAMLEYVREGDTVYVSEIARLARSTRDLFKIIDRLQQKNAEFISLKENIDTTTPQGRFVLTIFAALAEFERECIRQRQLEGQAVAKEQGRPTGRPRKEYDQERFRAVCRRWKNGEISATEARKELDMTQYKFYSTVKELGI